MSLIEHDGVINDQHAVSTILNQHYVTITEHIGYPDDINECECFDEVVEPHRNHGSVSFIGAHLYSLKP